MENPFLWLVDTIITLYIWILIGAAILSWLIAFNVVNTRNHFVAAVGNFFYHVTEPALRPIRSVMPNLGGIDISPVILIIGLLFLERIIFWVYARASSDRADERGAGFAVAVGAGRRARRRAADAARRP